MSRTLNRQSRQIRRTPPSEINDKVAPSEASYQDNTETVQDDLNNLRSAVNDIKSLRSGNWYDPLATPTVPELGAQRGVDKLNIDLHALEAQRWLREVPNLTDIVVPGGQNFIILGAGQIPTPPKAAVGTTTTLGTVVATHTGTFGTTSLDQVLGSSVLSPGNLLRISEGDSKDPIFSQGDQIWGLLQGESTLVDGGPIIATSPGRVQITFVRINGFGNGFAVVPVADIENIEVNYCFRERVRLKDLAEGDLLKGANVEFPEGGGGGSGITEGEHEVLDTLTHQVVENSVDEVIRNSKGKINNYTVWTDSGKTTKIRETQITRVCGKVSQVIEIQYDSAGTEIYRTVEDVTRVGSEFGEGIVDTITRTRI